jgi:PAS domain S-box-containing protein
VRQQAGFAELSQRALAGADLDRLLQEATGLIARTLRVEHASFLELISGGTRLQLRAGIGWQPGEIGSVDVDVTPGSPATYVLRNASFVIIDDIAKDNRFPTAPFFKAHGFASGMGVRVGGRESTFGILGAFSRSKHAFSADDAHFLQSIANVVGLAIERKQDEYVRQELLERERQIRVQAEHLALERATVLKQMTDGVVLAAPNGQISLANDSACRLFGAKSPAINETAFYDLEGRPLSSADQPLNRAVSSGETVADQWLRLRRPDGSEIEIQASATPLVADDGTRLGGVLVFRDATVQRAFERQKSAFVEAMSHELRTPLTVIRGNAQYLSYLLERHRPLERQAILSRLAKIDETATHVNDIANDLLALTRGSAHDVAGATATSATNLPTTSQQLASVRRIARVIAQQSSLEQTAADIAEGSLGLFGAAAVSLWLVDLERQEMRLAARRSVAVPHPETLRTLAVLPLTATSFAAAAARDGRSVEVRDTAAVGEDIALGAKVARLEGLHAVLSQPLFARGRLVGVMSILYATPHTFVPEERELARALGDLWAIAIDNARLFSEAQNAIKRLNESLALLATLQEKAPIGFAFIDRDLNLVRVNEAMAAINGVPADMTEGRPLAETLPDIAAKESAAVCQVLKTGVPILHREVRGETPAAPGDERFWDSSYYPVRTEDGEIIGVGILVEETTARRRSEIERAKLLASEQASRSRAELAVEDLRKAERLREEWLSVIAHDLRQPATVIQGYVDRLDHALASRADASRERQLLGHVSTAVRNLNQMVGDLLEISRLETHRLTIEPRPLDLATLVRGILERLAAVTPDNRFRLQVHGKVPRVYADAARVEQLLGNLLTNAVKYGYPGREIWVDLARRRHEVEIAVTNEGEGISPEELPLLFQRFHRTRQATEQGIAGLGLGLYIAKGLVEAHGGRIWAESAPGQTTTFHSTLPVFRVDYPTRP